MFNTDCVTCVANSSIVAFHFLLFLRVPRQFVIFMDGGNGVGTERSER
jgi:hypothetical protein